MGLLEFGLVAFLQPFLLDLFLFEGVDLGLEVGQGLAFLGAGALNGGVLEVVAEETGPDSFC